MELDLRLTSLQWFLCSKFAECDISFPTNANYAVPIYSDQSFSVILLSRVGPFYLFNIFRSSHWRCSVRKGVLRNFAKFTENTCARVSFLIKLRAALLKKRLWHRCFPVNFAKFLRTPFSQNTSW